MEKPEKGQPSPIVIDGDIARMTVYKESGPVEFIFDAEDVPLVRQVKTKWVCVAGYAVARVFVEGGKRGPKGGTERKAVLLHRMITNAPKGLQVDHINGDKSDNRRSNLQVVEMRLNLQNTTKSSGRSGYRNVNWCSAAQKWVVILKVNGAPRRFGQFTDVKKAAEVAAECRLRYRPNSPESLRAKGLLV